MTTIRRSGIRRPGGSAFKAPRISNVDHICEVDEHGIARPICGSPAGTLCSSNTDALCSRCETKRAEQ